MRRGLILLCATILVLGLAAPTAMADMGGNPNEHAAEEAVGSWFGQWRAFGAHLLKDAGISMGQFIKLLGDTPQSVTIHAARAGLPPHPLLTCQPANG